VAKIIGQHYTRDPYPWDASEKTAGSENWICCDMNLPTTFYICPICERERDLDSEKSM
jgi:hypothetical protein